MTASRGTARPGSITGNTIPRNKKTLNPTLPPPARPHNSIPMDYGCFFHETSQITFDLWLDPQIFLIQINPDVPV